MALASACDQSDSSAGADDLYMDDDVPSGNCMGDTGPCDTDDDDDDDGGNDDATASGGGAEDSGAGATPVGGTCEATMQCEFGLTCIATFDGDIGEFECQSSCIEDDDESRWCIDDDSCCNDGSVCSERGYCRPAEASDTSSGEGSTGFDTDGSTGDGGSSETGG
jgi:hypothetical protein